MSTFKIGDRVRVKASEAPTFNAEIARKISGGRVGTIRSLSFPNEDPVIVFPAMGRRKAFTWCARPEWLDAVV